MKERRPPPPMPTAGVLEEEPDFVADPNAPQSYCRHCGVVKEASAKFFVDHYRECVEPRRRERAEAP